MKHSTKFISIGLLISFAAACGGSNDESGRVKNAALTTLSKPAFTTTTKATTVLSPVTTTGVLSGTSPLSGEAGGTLDAKISLSWDKYARPAYTPAVVDTSKLSIAPEVLERLRAVSSQVRYMPVVVRLPVPYDAIKRATELSTQTKQISTDGLSERPKVGQIPVMTTDVAILDATRALSDFLDSMPDWQWLKRSVSVADLHKAADLFAGNPPKTAQAGDSQSKVVAAATYVAQLGQTPFVRALLTAAEIEELAAKRLIVSAGVDNYGVTDLDQSMPVIGSHEPTTFGGATGSGAAIAIFDTGVMSTHPAFGSRVVRQRCYTAGSDCANGSTSDTSANSAMPCTFSNRCDHGTHVAGIAAGAAVPTATLASPGADGSAVATGSTSWHAGVAPQATILAYRLGSRGSDGQPGFWDSDFVLAAGDLSTVVTSQNVVSMNYSVGSTETYSDSTCDRDVRTSAAAMVDAIDTLQAQNVAVVIAAGNSNSTSRNSFPGCLVEPVSVSSTSIEDTIAAYSNISAGRTDLLAPGGDSTTAGGAIIAPSVSGSALDTATYEAKNGTSMAAPTVAGAWALVRQITPSMNVASVLAMLQDTGKSVTDARTGGTVAKKRIDLSSILPLETSSGIKNVVAKFSGNRKTMSQGTALTRNGVTTATTWNGTVKFPASPLFAPNTAEGAYLFFSTRDGTATSVTVNGTVYTTELVQSGYSATPCRAKSPMRSYRVALTASTLTGSNSVSIATSKTTFVDGVSMFLVSRQAAGLAVGGSVVITDGLGVMNAESGQMSAAVPAAADLAGRPVSLHVAVADGQSAAESGILFKTSNTISGSFVTPAGQFSGSDGLNWDDHTFDLSGKGLSGTPGLLVVSHTGVPSMAARDCLAFVAAMLNIGAQPLSTMLTPVLNPTVVGSGPNTDRGVVRPTVTFTPVR